jgi:hypothetical protein
VSQYHFCIKENLFIQQLLKIDKVLGTSIAVGAPANNKTDKTLDFVGIMFL